MNTDYADGESRNIEESESINLRRSECSPSTSGSLISDTEPLAQDSATFLAESYDNCLDISLTDLPGSPCTQLHGSSGTDYLWFDDQFDLEAMESSIMEANKLPGLSNEQFLSVSLSATDTATGDALTATSGAIKRQMEVCKAIHSRWYTRPVPEPGIPQPSVSVMNQEEVDEEYRIALSTRLAPSPQDIALPSTEFLV